MLSITPFTDVLIYNDKQSYKKDISGLGLLGRSQQDFYPSSLSADVNSWTLAGQYITLLAVLWLAPCIVSPGTVRMPRSRVPLSGHLASTPTGTTLYLLIMIRGTTSNKPTICLLDTYILTSLLCLSSIRFTLIAGVAAHLVILLQATVTEKNIEQHADISLQIPTTKAEM